MTIDWRTLEREIIAILREHDFHITNDASHTVLYLDYDFPMSFSLTTFAKDLAKRMEQAQ